VLIRRRVLNKLDAAIDARSAAAHQAEPHRLLTTYTATLARQALLARRGVTEHG
jgi:hypothetical protein